MSPVCISDAYCTGKINLIHCYVDIYRLIGLLLQNNYGNVNYLSVDLNTDVWRYSNSNYLLRLKIDL